MSMLIVQSTRRTRHRGRHCTSVLSVYDTVMLMTQHVSGRSTQTMYSSCKRLFNHSSRRLVRSSGSLSVESAVITLWMKPENVSLGPTQRGTTFCHLPKSNTEERSIQWVSVGEHRWMSRLLRWQLTLQRKGTR